MTYRKNALVALFALLATVVGVSLLLAFPAGAHATTTEAGPGWKSCPNLKDFYENEDERDRAGTPTADGLQLQGDQLVHHRVDMDLKDVHPGSYAATPAPSLTSFFSIEVYSTADPHGYATLRWDTVAEKWNIGGTDFYDVDPVKLATDHNRSTNVISFGVGYVAHPADGARTLVSSITFHGVTYPLTCKPKPSSTPSSSSPAPSKSPTAKPSASHTPGTGVHTIPNPPQNGPALAITGPSTALLGIGAAVLTGIGALMLVVSRRRKTTWRA